MISKKDRNQVISDVRHAMVEFQIGDLEKSAKAGLNFLTAIGLMVSTEFLGGLVTGNLGLAGLSEARFESGFMQLGKPYADFLSCHKRGVLDIYRNVRCGFIHQYLPPHVMGVLNVETFAPGMKETNGQLVIFVSDYLRDLKAAVTRLLDDLDKDNDLFLNCQKALSQVPKLL